MIINCTTKLNKLYNNLYRMKKKNQKKVHLIIFKFKAILPKVKDSIKARFKLLVSFRDRVKWREKGRKMGVLVRLWIRGLLMLRLKSLGQCRILTKKRNKVNKNRNNPQN